MYRLLRNISTVPLRRFFSNYAPPTVLQHLNERSLLRVQGEEVSEFLQGLITNDIRHLDKGPGSMFTMLLNTKGRVLFDAIIYTIGEKNTYLIECDKEAVSQFQKHLKLYRVKRKIEVSCLDDNYKIHVLFNPNNLNETINTPTENNELLFPCDKLASTEPGTSMTVFKDLFIYKDPRVTNLGSRVISKSPINVTDRITELVHVIPALKTQNQYKTFRYQVGVGEGVNDLPPGNCFPLESNCDYLHGISFHKGCYIGQELTARTHHTGVVRKRLMPLQFIKIPTKLPGDNAIVHQKIKLGKIRGIEGDSGLALLRIKQALEFREIEIEDGLATVSKPCWWPVELPKEKLNVQKSEI